MTDVLHRATLEFRERVHTPAFSDPPWLIDPDMSGVAGVPTKYQKLVGDTPIEMDQSEKDAVDAAALEAERQALADGLASRELVGALGRVMLDEFNILRAEHGLAPRTLQQLKNAVRAKINS